MRKLLFAILMFSCVCSYAQNIKTQITNVTVYKYGALVSRVGTVDVKKGTATFNIEDISTELDPNSIRISVDNDNVTIVSVNHEYDVKIDSETEARNKKISDRKQQLKDSIRILEAKYEVLRNEKELILANQKVGTSNGTSVTDLSSMAQYYKSELTSIEMQKLKLSKKEKEQTDALNQLVQASQNDSKETTKKISRVKLTLKADADIKSLKVRADYLVYDASWTPYYEVRVKDVNDPLSLVYSARVRQSSAEDWNNVRLTLSTGDPSVDNTKPDFQIMYLPPNSNQNTRHKTWKKPVSGYVYGKVVDTTGEPVIGAAVMAKNTTCGTVTDIDGMFKLELPDGVSTLSFYYVGYNQQEVDAYENMYVVMDDEGVELEEVVAVAYGTQNEGRLTGADYVLRKDWTGKPVTKTNIPVTLNESMTSTEFEIDMPYTIAADNKECKVSMLTYEIPADYLYSCAPRMSKDVYLMASIPESYQYSLLKGDAALFLENAYQGESHIAPNATQDTLNISVGRDKSIAVSRDEVKSNSSRSFLGSTAKIQKTYEITIRNNKQFEAIVEVEDQYPISKTEDIKVTLLDNGGAKVNAETGKLVWNVKLKPQETRKIRFSYEIKYPKNRYNINID